MKTMKITEYTIVAQGDPISLAIHVSNRIGQGWQPFGSMTTVTEAGNFLHCQAMVMYEE